MSITLNGKEIKDLAEFMGYTIDDKSVDEDQFETEIVIMEGSGIGLREDDKDETPRYYDHIAYFSEYPDEGSIGLGDEFVGN